MKRNVLLLFCVIVSACSTYQPPRYYISVDNNLELKKHSGAKINISNFDQSAAFYSFCRGFGPISPADGLSVGEFIKKAFNDEFKMAEIYSSSGTTISGDVTKIKFSSVRMLTQGYWEIGIQLNSSNGTTMEVENTYHFESGFGGETACNATADALTPAVQDLINKTVRDEKFKRLL